MHLRLLRPPPLSSPQWRLLGLVALAASFGSYNLALLSLALPQIQAELGIAGDQMSRLGALIRLGSLPAFAFALSADRWGRRRLLLLAIVAYTLLTGATAFASTPLFFALCQFGVRLFVSVAVVLAHVMLVEEFPAHARLGNWSLYGAGFGGRW